MKSHKEQIVSNKKHQKKSRARRPVGGKKYKTDIESSDEFISDEEDKRQNGDEFDQEMSDEEKQFEDQRHKENKNVNCVQIKKQHFAKMKYMLDIGFNLLIFGVGSKYDITNLFI